MEPFLGEIRIFGFDWAPKGWALCNGALIQCAQNQALNALIGKIYGGDGVKTFALPDLRGRAPLAAGRAANSQTTYNYGAQGGAEGVTLAMTDIPAHTHGVNATKADATSPLPTGLEFAQVAKDTPLYGNAVNDPPTLTALSSSTITSAGGGGPHNNMQPYLTVNFCIAISEALWPPRP